MQEKQYVEGNLQPKLQIYTGELINESTRLQGTILNIQTPRIIFLHASENKPK